MSYADDSIKNKKHFSQTAITSGYDQGGTQFGIGKVAKPTIGENPMVAAKSVNKTKKRRQSL